MGRRQKRRQAQHKHGRPLWSWHHYIPRSRGGTDDWYNKGLKLDEKHRAWHRLFANMSPSEVVKRLEEWALEEHRLGDKETAPWEILFGGASYEKAIEIVKKEWFGPSGEIPKYLESFLASRSDYSVRIDCLKFASRMVAGEAHWSDSWVGAFRKVANDVMRGISKETKVPLKKINTPKPGGESILDVQLRAVQDLFNGKCIDKFGVVVPIEIRYDGYYLFRLNRETQSVDSIVRFLDFPRLFNQIIHPLLAAIIFEEIKAGDKIIFAIDENNQPGIWRQKRPKEK